jgi:hypothetical protein
MCEPAKINISFKYKLREATLTQDDKRKLKEYLKPSAHNKSVLILFVSVSTLIIWGLKFFL